MSWEEIIDMAVSHNLDLHIDHWVDLDTVLEVRVHANDKGYCYRFALNKRDTGFQIEDFGKYYPSYEEGVEALKEKVINAITYILL